jgi:hypothetical protein
LPKLLPNCTNSSDSLRDGILASAHAVAADAAELSPQALEFARAVVQLSEVQNPIWLEAPIVQEEINGFRQTTKNKRPAASGRSGV